TSRTASIKRPAFAIGRGLPTLEVSGPSGYGPRDVPGRSSLRGQHRQDRDRDPGHPQGAPEPVDPRGLRSPIDPPAVIILGRPEQPPDADASVERERHAYLPCG